MTSRTPYVFGRFADGSPCFAVDLVGAQGLRARVLSYGAVLQSVRVPGQEETDVILGYGDAGAYERGSVFMGAVVGRYANRIAGGRFSLDGQRCHVTRNEGENTLHGGVGFHRARWAFEPVGAANSASLTHFSPDGDDGFPGALAARVTYVLEEDNALTVTFEARSDRATVVNLTQHAYFNLAGDGQSIDDHEIEIAADGFTPIDAASVPTGDVRSVAGTPFDLRAPVRIGDQLAERDDQLKIGGGFDHNYALRQGKTAAPKFAARLFDPRSGRTMTLLTTEPGLQFYTGQFLDGAIGKSGRAHGTRTGLCLEPQYFPDAPNRPQFESPRLDPGQVYRHVSIYKFGTRP